jgi:hypothetical protein
MPKHLSEREIETYHRDGAVFPITNMSEPEAVEHRRRLEVAESEHGRLHDRTKP